ncbi:hypothetical protein [Marmoricola sp. RAF53]|uniref:hypothetical protein n=1 Tax=Marmoricola sp. RAF53 TaxID=3233059 RepID=UPI003F9DDFBE
MHILWTTCAVAGSLIGVLLAIGHLVGLGLLWIRHSDPRPDLVPWGYAGVGLAVSLGCFSVVRGLGTGEWGEPVDMLGLIIVLLVASAGFGAVVEWATVRCQRQVPWVLPLGLSAFTGLALGLSASTLGI